MIRLTPDVGYPSRCDLDPPDDDGLESAEADYLERRAAELDVLVDADRVVSAPAKRRAA